jgi:hypothetical protein
MSDNPTIVSGDVRPTLGFSTSRRRELAFERTKGVHECRQSSQGRMQKMASKRMSLIMVATLHNRDLFKQFPFCNVGW